MTSNFPTGPDTITNNVTNGTLQVDTHPGVHNQLADAVMAVETALLPGGTMNLAAHVAAADPHAVYLTQTEGDARYTTIAGGIPDGSITSAKIADGTIVAGDLADGAVTSAKILDGTIATADLANGSVTNAKLAADTARANLLTNGGFEIWQRGNGPFTATAAYTADRWQTYVPGGTTISVLRDTTSPDSAGSGVCAAVTVGGSVSAGNSVLVSQPIGDGGLQFRSRTLTFSARIATGVAGGARLRVQLVGGGADVFSAAYSGGGAYQTLSATFTPTAGASGQVAILNFEFTAAGSYWIDNAMLVVGSVAADYAPLHPADDLARCQRYYEKLGDAVGYPVVFMGYNTAGAPVGSGVGFRTKAVTPTVTKVGTWYVSNCAQPGVGGQTVDGCQLSTAATAAASVHCQANGAGQYLTAEANP